MRWVVGRHPHPSPLPPCGRGSRKSTPASALYRLQCTAKFEPVTQPVRDKSDQVRARHIASAIQKQPTSSPSHSQCETKATKFEPVTQPVRDKSNQVRARHIASARQKQARQQAVMERVCDEKSGERRGDNLKITTQAVACFRKIFRESKFLHRRNVTKPGQTS